MNIYDATGRTPEQLLDYAQRNHKEFSFRNEPYHHHVYVVCDSLEFGAMCMFAKAHLNYPNMEEYHERYKTVGGLTISWESMGIQYSVICLHAYMLGHYDPKRLMGFLSTTVHEQQHMLTRAERKTGADYTKEDEPRAYSTAWTLERIMQILRKRWSITLVSVPEWMIPRVTRLDELCNTLNSMIDPNTVYSGTLRQYMEGRTELVRYQNDRQSWYATTYWSGGQPVNEKV